MRNIISVFVFCFTLFLCCSFSLNSSDAVDSLSTPYIYNSVNVINGSYVESTSDLSLLGAENVILRRTYQSEVPSTQGSSVGWFSSLPSLFTRNSDHDALLINDAFDYEYDKSDRLVLLKTKEKQGKRTVHFSYKNEGSEISCKAKVDDGTTLRYTYFLDTSNRGYPAVYLKKVEKNGKLLASYSYEPHPLTRSLVLTKKEEANHHALEIAYYQLGVNRVGKKMVVINDPTDFRLGRVMLLKVPNGTDSAMVATQYFYYEKDSTEVRDALNHKVVYEYGEHQRITAILSYDEQNHLYKAERFSWKWSSSSLVPLMTSRSLENAKGKQIMSRSFDYDEAGYLIKEKLIGNLTGKNGSKDSYEIKYQYEKGLVVTKEEGSHLKVSYEYDEKRRLIAEHRVVDGSFHTRTFYDYDSEGSLVKTIVDDGTATEKNKTTGVSQRRITKIIPSTDSASFGQPLIVEERYWDPKEGKEHLLEKRICDYDAKGNLVRQRSLDAQEGIIKDESYTYDSEGRLKTQNQKRGDIASNEYDVSGNLVLQSMHETNGHVSSKKMSYDFNNRLVMTEEADSDGASKTIRHFYNTAGMKTSDTQDGRGKTTYTHDALGRITEIHHPAIRYANGKIGASVTRCGYDEMNHLTYSMDGNGWETHAEYNVRSKPTKILYPDGTQETFEYNTAGFLIRETFRNELTAVYTRDGLGRLLKTVMLDRNHQTISTESWSYTSFSLKTHTDVVGCTTTYSYDGAGRERKVVQEAGNRTKRVDYIYDERGRVSAKRTHWPSGNTIEILEYDSDDKPTFVKTIDENGKILQRYSLEKSVAPAKKNRQGYEANSLGQEALYNEETDAQGVTTKTLFDAMGNPSSVIRKNCLGQTINKISYRYDAAGNKTQEIHSNADKSSQFTVSWAYGVGGRLEQMIEGEGEANQRVTSYAYNSRGQMKSMTKPDGVSLFYKYDAAGRLARVHSSDNTIDYAYTFDAKGRVLLLTDLLTGEATERRYAPDSYTVTEEKLANHLRLEFKFNEVGQRTHLLLPDDSAIGYTYKGQELNKIYRIGNQGETLYHHTFQEYHNGKVSKESLIGNLGSVTYKYDEDNALVSVDSAYWSELSLRDSLSRLMGGIVKKSSGAQRFNYHYNDVGQLAKESGFTSQTYDYDYLGNFDNQSFDSLNQLKSNGKAAFKYDANGNLISQKEGKTTIQYHYDALNRLISAVWPNQQRVEMTYDGFNRRLTKTVFSWNMQKKEWVKTERDNYFYDGMCEIGSTNGKRRLTQLRVLHPAKGVEGGAAVAIELEGRAYAPIHDVRGNLSALVDVKDRSLVESYCYTAFGSRSIYDADGELLDESAVGMPWGFASKRTDSETGWVFFGFRYYDPSLSRWTSPDPLGFADGPNRYAYVQNDPVNNQDFFGEFTVGQLLKSCVKTLKSGLNLVRQVIDKTFLGGSRSTHKIVAYTESIVGSIFLRLAGLYGESAETGVVGDGEVSDKVRVTMVNGILNIRREYLDVVGTFSELHGGVNIHYIFRPSRGWIRDLYNCTFVKLGGESSQARLLAKTWKHLINEMGGCDSGGVIYHYAHSIGGTETNNAKRLLSSEEKKMIRVVTLGSPTLIREGDFQSTVNYVSWRDGVSCFDIVRYCRSLQNKENNVYFVGSLWGIPLIDHLVDNDSYLDVIRTLGAEFVRAYGTPKE